MKTASTLFCFALASLCALPVLAQNKSSLFEQRERDWRNGSVVYQVLVDRFVPSANLEAKRHLYPAPKVVKNWNEPALRGTYSKEAGVWTHEIEFWGGDLQSLASKLDYIEQLGAQVLYLNPIHLAYTNHKYDSLDFQKVSPEYGTRDDVKKLAANLKSRKMKLVLDGVFNHLGRNSPIFKQALADPKSPYRHWFYFGPQYKWGVRSWYQVENLPELNLENAAVRDYLFVKPDSVVRSYLRDGVDGWRLDVAVDIGFDYLGQLTRAAHAQKPGSLVVGEIANFPKEWFPSVDGVMNFTLREVIIRLARGELTSPQAAQMMYRIVDEAGIDNILKSWLLLDNHDIERIATSLPNQKQRKLAQVLQFTLPGSPNLYYGSEVGMTGGDDPEMRSPMRWDLVAQQEPTLAWTKQLIALRKQHRALRVGNFRPVVAQQLLAFERYTDKVADTVVVVANPSQTELTETLLVTNSRLMNGFNLKDQFSEFKTRIESGLIKVTVPAGGYLLLKPEILTGDYTAYKRVP
jgi:cyclomaltodextrinase / maltogenic alpha-amylase / neopullulanase